MYRICYISKKTTLKEMVDHIYGRINLITHPNRPNMFVKEITLYVDFLIKKIEESTKPFSTQTEQFFDTFSANLIDGINYYKKIVPEIIEETEHVREKMVEELQAIENRIASYFFAAVE